MKIEEEIKKMIRDLESRIRKNSNERIGDLIKEEKN